MIELLSEPMKVYKLKVVLVRVGPQEIEEEVSRTFEVGADHTLYNLHMDVQNAFNWDNDHLFSFYLGGKLFDRANEYSGDPLGGHIMPRIGPPSKSAAATQIRDLQLTENATFLYLFDYGDELVHEIIVEQIRDKNDQDKTLPSIVNKVGKPPPQYG